MTEREKKNPFELYTEVAESWFDLFGSWAKMSAELPTPPKTSDVTEWTKPFNSYFGDWSRIYSNFLETMNKFPYDPMKDLNEAIIKGANSYVEIYNTWIKNMDKVMRKGYEVTQGLAKEEEVDVGEFYDTLRKSNEEIVNSMLESLKDTPFEEVEYVKDAQEKFLDSFSEEREQTREFFRKFFNTNVKLANSWNSMLKKVNEKFTPMLRRGEISADTYREIIKTSKGIYQESLDMLEPYKDLFPEQEEVIANTEDWMKKYLDVSSTWFEMMLKAYEGVEKSSKDISELTEKFFEEGEVESLDDLTKKWSEIYEKATTDLVESAQFTSVLPDFTDKLVEYVRSTRKLYQSMAKPPGVSESEIEKIRGEIEELKDSIKKKKER